MTTDATDKIKEAEKAAEAAVAAAKARAEETVENAKREAEKIIADAKLRGETRMMGREGWVLSPDLGTSARFINVNIDNKTAYDIADGSSYAVEVDYYDEGISSLTLEYPSMKYIPLTQTETAAEITQPALNSSVKTSEGEYLVFGEQSSPAHYC